MQLTDQQQAIVEHTWGPALVFAVAGSGKTTCMVQRIKRLLEKKIVPPEKILATSFNNSAVQDIIAQLTALGVPSTVQCRTLHALGYQLLRMAAARKYLPREWLAGRDPEGLHTRLIGQTLTRMALEQGIDSSELNIDREDLKNQISIWKGNLVYPDLEAAALPETALKLARQAHHAHEVYLQAYRTYEKLRLHQKALTFDDMLLSGWEILQRFPDILQTVRSQYQVVMVDEFQDLNFAQYCILDLITEPHRNYMAIGDDDQCIYPWRGASPEYILNFEKTYRAKVYTISDNFRSSAPQLILANEMIARNQNRYPKRLSLTRGFGGQTLIHKQPDDLAIARSIVAEIRRLLRSGEATAQDMAILIRLYSQTALLETALIEAGIPYRIEGNDPFYKRSELVALFQYLSFAEAEQTVRRKGFPTDPQQSGKYLQMLESIANTPRRYIAKDFVKSAVQQARRQRASVVEVMLAGKEELKGRSRERVAEFAKLIERLIRKLNQPAHKTLAWLAQEIQYKEYLLAISGIYEVGITKIHTVDALVEFARTTRLRCGDFLNFIRDLSRRPSTETDNPHALKIMTIYKAKGLEWDTVFVPGCNEGLIPCAAAAPGTPGDAPLLQDLEAERRLFYVAITRARNTLHLYHSAEKPLSPFLAECRAETLLEEVEKMKEILQQKRPLLRRKDLERFCRNIARFHLERYFSQWAKEAPGPNRTYAKLLVENLELKVKKAEREYQAYQAKLQEQQEALQHFEQGKAEWQRRIQRGVVIVQKFKSALYLPGAGEILHFERLRGEEVLAMSSRGVVGTVDFTRMPEIGKADLDWKNSQARVERLAPDGSWLSAQLTKALPPPNHPQFIPPAARPPEALPQKTRELLDPGFRKGLEVLRKLLG